MGLFSAAAGPNKSGGVDQEDGPATLTVTTGGETHVKSISRCSINQINSQ